MPLLSPNGADDSALLDLPPIEVEASELQSLRLSPLHTLLRLPATLERVDVPLPPHDQW